MRMRRHFHLNFQRIQRLCHSCYNIPVIPITLTIYAPLTEWGDVWGTSVTVPVTIKTSYYYYSSFSSPVLFCPGMFSKTTGGINMKLSRMTV